MSNHNDNLEFQEWHPFNKAVKKVLRLAKDYFIEELPRRYQIGQAIRRAVREGCEAELIYNAIRRQGGPRPALLANCLAMVQNWKEQELAEALATSRRFEITLNCGHIMALGEVKNRKVRNKLLLAVMCDGVSCWELMEWLQDYQSGIKEVGDELFVFESARDPKSRDIEILSWNDD